MSADRYEITDNDASIRCQKPGKGPLILYACDHDSSTQKIIAVIRQLRSDLAAVTAERDALRTENAALLAANRDSKLHFDALKGDYDEAAHFGRHFVRDDPHITPLGAIIRLGDKCTDLFIRLQQAETQLAEYVESPVVAHVNSLSQDAPNYLVAELLPPQHRPPIGTELIARVKK